MKRLWLSLFALTVACGDDDGMVLDASLDASVLDAGADVGPRDSGPPCLLECEVGTTCCFGADGEPACVDLQGSPDHCGQCGFVCSAERGTACVEGFCECGRVAIGCEGNRANLCCPAREDRPEPYCANLLTDAINCGGCGEACDERTSDQCLAGECSCGDERRACDVESELCCLDLGGAASSCVEPATDRSHCGACGRRCRAGEDCVEGACRSRFDSGVADSGVDGGTEDDLDAGTDSGIDAGLEGE